MMTAIEEIFSEVAQRMILGMMVHDEMTQYYEFLSLPGYAKCHEYHFVSESCNYRKLMHYYLKHHNKLIKEFNLEDTKIIPSSWYSYERREVDATTKRNAVKSGLEKWVTWEKETKEIYEKAFKDLMDLGEIADAEFLKCFVCDVSKELAHAESEYIEIRTLDFEIGAIMGCQSHKKRKYKKLLMEE